MDVSLRRIREGKFRFRCHSEATGDWLNLTKILMASYSEPFSLQKSTKKGFSSFDGPPAASDDGLRIVLSHNVAPCMKADSSLRESPQAVTQQAEDGDPHGEIGARANSGKIVLFSRGQ